MLCMKQIPSIAEHWENPEKGTRSHTEQTRTHIWGHRSTDPLASSSTCPSTEWLSSALRGGAGLFLATASADQGSALLASESLPCWEGIGFAVIGCIPDLPEVNTGICKPMALWLSTHLIGVETTATSVSLSSRERICPSLPLGRCAFFLNPTKSRNLALNQQELECGLLP